MKKLLFSVGLLAALTLFLGSCKDDDPKNGGSFTYDGKKYTLAHAYITSDGTDTEGDDSYSYWFLVLVSSGLEYEEDDEWFNGEGDLIYVYLSAANKADNETLPAGTYLAPSDDGEDRIDYGEFWLNYKTEAGTRDEIETDVDDASITVTKSGTRYTLKFIINFEDDKQMTGSFSGPIEEVLLD